MIKVKLYNADIPISRDDIEERLLQKRYTDEKGFGFEIVKNGSDFVAQFIERTIRKQEFELPDGEVLLVETADDVATLSPRDPDQLAYITQTTLSVDDTAGIVTALKARFPKIVGPHKEDICYATTNRQEAVKAVAPKVQALLVIGAPNSSNSRRLVEVARANGCDYSMLVQRATEIDWRAIEGVSAVGLTAGASAPQVLVDEVINAFRDRYEVTLELVETAQENIEFKLPRVLREPA